MDADARARRDAKDEAREERERAVIDEVFRMDDIRITGREIVDGRPTIIVSFTPRPGVRPGRTKARSCRSSRGRPGSTTRTARSCGSRRALVDTMAVGPAKVARLQPVAIGFFQRRKVNDEVWLPDGPIHGRRRAPAVFGARVDVYSEFGDYKKFSVATEEEVAPTPENPGD